MWAQPSWLSTSTKRENHSHHLTNGAKKPKKRRNEKTEIDPKTAAVIYIVGVLLSFVMTGINSLLTLANLQLIWTTWTGILLSLIIFPFIYGAIAHLIDNFLMGEHIDLDDTRILAPIWIVGVVLSFIMLGVNSIFTLLKLSLDWTTLSGIILSFAIFPWLYGYIAHWADNLLT